MTVPFKAFPDRESAAAELANQIGERLTAGIARKGRASLAVSGGTTPVALFERLSAMDVGWSEVVITLVDERWLAPTDDDSNERLVQSHLLKGRAAATFIGLKMRRPPPAPVSMRANKRQEKFPGPSISLSWEWGLTGTRLRFFPRPGSWPGQPRCVPPQAVSALRHAAHPTSA
jgi:6-phosphogluconolactonase